MRHLIRAVSALMVVLAAACASTGAAPESTGSSRNVITSEQLLATKQSNLYDAINRLRPMWLRARGISQVTPGIDAEVQVYRETTRLGTVEVLRTLAPQNVARVEYLDPGAAQIRFGRGSPNGAIVVTVGS